MVTNQLKNQHLLWRAGFGISAEDVSKLANVSPQKVYEELEKRSLKKPEYIDVADNSLKGLFMGIDDAVKAQQQVKELSAGKKKEIKKQSREDIKNLNIHWLDEMVFSEAQLREKIALFWHGHFSCRVINIFYQQLLLGEIRSNALGNFGDLLMAVSKSAAMLSFLNNQQNQKKHPNENFAREVMELFTLGRGNYTEQDVKEAARAFTGWGFKLNGDFVFRSFFHDEDEKIFLGKQGRFNGDDILNILLEQKQTAKFITQKIYRYFVNDNADEEHVTWLSNRFYESNYNIKNLLRDIFTSSWFYEEKNIAVKIKSPVELLAGIRRMLPMQLENEGIQILLQTALGQLLFYPPNVAGWPGGKTWIDSSTLMLRLQLPQLITDDDSFYITPKPDDDQQMGMGDNTTMQSSDNMKAPGKSRFNIRTNIDWNKYIQQFDSVPRNQLYNVLEAVVLQTQPGSVNGKAASALINSGSREEYIKTVTIALMSTPEYQLC